MFAVIGRNDGTVSGRAVIWNLDSVAQNQKRINRLIAKFPSQITKPKDVWLLYNLNSNMGSAEADDFMNNLNGGGAVNTANGAHNDDTDFISAIKSCVDQGAKGIIVSADPFLFSKRGLIITEANTYQSQGLKMCYPNTEFYNSANNDTTSTSVGPTLADVYKDLGVQAATYLNDNSAIITPGQISQLTDGK